MKIQIKNFIKKHVYSLDGNVGKIIDVYFDDHHWTIRYFVVDTGGIFSRNEVLISPISITRESHQEGKETSYIKVNLTKNQIENSPHAEENKPISRHFEERYFSYYQIPYYWGYDNPWVVGPYESFSKNELYPEKFPNADYGHPQILKTTDNYDYHLRSSKEVIGYRVHSKDEGRFGEVKDIVINPMNFAIEYLLVDPVFFWPGKWVLIDRNVVQEFSWADREVRLNLTREQIHNAPHYEKDKVIDNLLSGRLNEYYRPYRVKTDCSKESDRRASSM